MNKFSNNTLRLLIKGSPYLVIGRASIQHSRLGNQAAVCRCCCFFFFPKNPNRFASARAPARPSVYGETDVNQAIN